MDIENKLYDDYVIVNSSFYKNEEPFICGIISDIHFHKKIDTNIFDNLIYYYLDKKIDIFIIPGDIICNANFLDNNLKDYITLFLRELSFHSPILITFGNHELKEREQEIKTFFESLERYNNIIVLNNKQIKMNNITFSGFCPSYKTYLKYHDKNNYENIIKEYIQSGIMLNKNDFNVFITHSPLTINNEYIKNEVPVFSFIDLLISGHMHNGYVPKSFTTLNEKTQKGLLLTSPFHMYLTKNNCRGIDEYGRGKIVVTKGFRKLISNSSLINSLEKYSSNDVTTLELRRKI